MQFLGHPLEAAIAGTLSGIGGEAVHQRGHLLDIFQQVDLGIVFEEAAPLRIEADERQFLR